MGHNASRFGACELRWFPIFIDNSTSKRHGEDQEEKGEDTSGQCTDELTSVYSAVTYFPRSTIIAWSKADVFLYLDALTELPPPLMYRIKPTEFVSQNVSVKLPRRANTDNYALVQ